MGDYVGAEKLRVYRKAIDFVRWGQSRISGFRVRAAAVDHLDRGADSIVESIANGNSRRSSGDRNRYFDVAYGSALECAACLDVCTTKGLLPAGEALEGKREPCGIVKTIVGLRRTGAEGSGVCESPNEYAAPEHPVGARPQFGHESLDVCRAGIRLVGWMHTVLESGGITSPYAARLDKTSTAIVLNIAEGDGRFACLDHRRFIDIAHTAAVKTVTCLDIVVARDLLEKETAAAGKQLLKRIIPMLLGLRGYLDGHP